MNIYTDDVLNSLECALDEEWDEPFNGLYYYPRSLAIQSSIPDFQPRSEIVLLIIDAILPENPATFSLLTGIAPE